MYPLYPAKSPQPNFASSISFLSTKINDYLGIFHIFGGIASFILDNLYKTNENNIKKLLIFCCIPVHCDLRAFIITYLILYLYDVRIESRKVVYAYSFMHFKIYSSYLLLFLKYIMIPSPILLSYIQHVHCLFFCQA